MKIVMTMLVRDEADIIRFNLDFHLAMGVDYFIIMDHGSSDDTLNILRNYCSQGLVKVYHQSNPGYYQSQWVTQMAREAAVLHGADWVINNDADEFWWPNDGNIKKALSLIPSRIGGVHVQRSNFPPLKGMLSKHFYEDMVFRDLKSINSNGNPLPSKMCHRAAPDIIVNQGNHDANGSGIYEKCGTNLMEIFHFPLRNLVQFTNKIRSGGEAYLNSTNLDKSIGSTWRELYKLYKLNRLEEYYNKQCIGMLEIGSIYENNSRWNKDDRLKNFILKLSMTSRND